MTSRRSVVEAPGSGDSLPLLSGERVVDGAVAALRRAILAGDLSPGEKLSVPALSARLGVSRSPVREAVLALAAEGLAVESPRRGVVVAAIGPEEAYAIHEAREPLEGLSARLATERGQAGLLARLDAILAEQASAIAGQDEDGFFLTNAAFHAAIADAAGNPELVRLLESLEGRMALALRSVAAKQRHRDAALREHRTITDAIRRRDGAAAEAAMRSHIAATRARGS